MAVNLDSIMKKVDRFSKSVEGKKRIQAVLDRYKKEGVRKTAAGDVIVTEDMMHEAAAKLIHVLRQTAAGFGLPASVMEHFDSLDASNPIEMPDGSTVMYIYFVDNLHRESLDPDSYGGVDNIIAVLNNGYSAGDYVYGWWEGHEPTENNAYRSGWTGGRLGRAYIRSRKDREGLRFIQQAISDFNGNYGSDYNVTAVAGDDYR